MSSIPLAFRYQEKSKAEIEAGLKAETETYHIKSVCLGFRCVNAFSPALTLVFVTL